MGPAARFPRFRPRHRTCAIFGVTGRALSGRADHHLLGAHCLVGCQYGCAIWEGMGRCVPRRPVGRVFPRFRPRHRTCPISGVTGRALSGRADHHLLGAHCLVGCQHGCAIWEGMGRCVPRRPVGRVFPRFRPCHRTRPIFVTRGRGGRHILAAHATPPPAGAACSRMGTAVNYGTLRAITQ